MVKLAQLRAAFRNDLAAAWNRFEQLHPDHMPYAFVLYGVEGAPALSPHVLTEESLTEKAQQYLKDGSYDTLEQARKGIRYSVADSPLFSELENCFATVDALMKPHEDRFEETAGYALLAKAAMDAFREVDKQKIFGTGAKRKQLLLMIITGDTEKDWAKPSVKHLNSPAAYRRFEAETKIEGSFASSDALAVSPDGRSLYSAGGGDVDKDDDNEIVAYDLSGRGLKRRWRYPFPSFGDSGRALACARDGATVLVLRAKYSGDVCHALVMRFGRDRKAVLAETELRGEPTSLALSHDGLRIAVATHGKRLHILDETLASIQTLKLTAQPRDIRYLKSGDLLAATDGGLLRIDSRFKIKPTRYAKASFHLAVDDAEKLMAIGRWFSLSNSQREKNAEFGIQLLRLPALSQLRTVLVPGYQAIFPALSPDGRYLAFEAHQIGTFRRFVAVVETATGQQIARRKSDFIHDLEFLPNGRRLAIAISGHTTSEPVVLWSFANAAESQM